MDIPITPFLQAFEPEQREVAAKPEPSSCEPGRFKKNKLRVVVWKGRNTPGRRRIPKRLKLAILSRGRIRLPVENVKWLLDAYKDAGWVSRLTVDLSRVLSWVDVTVELYLNMRPDTLTAEKAGAVLAQYLNLRQKKYMKNCPFLLYGVHKAVGKKVLEQRLGVNLERLYRRPRVPLPKRMREKDRERFWLLVYAAFPSEIAKYVAPEEKPTPRPLPSPTPVTGKMPPFIAKIVPSCYNFRKEPAVTSDILGAIVDKTIWVTVTDKFRDSKRTWYKISLNQDVEAVTDVTSKRCKRPVDSRGKIVLPRKTVGWLGLDGPLVMAADWNFFRNQLIELEDRYGDLQLNARITKLRQLSHNRGTPFDPVIGIERGDTYLDDLLFIPDEWQILKDYQVVIMPDGRWVDIHHLLVGLDVLSRPELGVTFPGTGIYIGKNYAASTWAGDIGAAAAEATLKFSDWDRRHPGAYTNDRVDFYYGTRAAEWDLAADIDAWGIYRLRRSSNPATIDELLADYYQNTRPGGKDGTLITTRRKEAVELFLRHYGFRYDYRDHRYPDTLTDQRKPKGKIINAIGQFGKIWMLNRGGVSLLFKRRGKIYPEGRYVTNMTYHFLWWLERMAIENGSVT